MRKGYYQVGEREDGRICQMWIQQEPRAAEFWTGKIYSSMEQAQADIARLNESGSRAPRGLLPARSLARDIATTHGDEACDHIEKGDLDAAYKAARLAAHVALDV